VRDNAFYCPQGDFIAFDDQDLFPKIDAKYGPFVLGTILAHEWGHAIQARAGVDGPSIPTILLEQQADCFAGAWMAQLASGGGGPDLKVTDKEINFALAGMVTFSDQPGTSARDQQAHGSAFDRVGAFQDGFVNSASKCATYPQNPPSVVEIPFTSADDAASGGNLPFDQIVPLATKDLDRFWAEVFQQQGKTWAPLAGSVKTYRHDGPYPSCSGLSADDFKDHVVYCPSGDYIAYDQDTLSGTVNDIGDFAVGALLGNAYADAAQHRLGLSTTGKDKSLQEDCFTGAWSASDLPRTRNQQELTLSPGDLDEAVSAFLGFGSQSANQSSAAIGTPFDRIASFRKGFFEGVKSCGLGG
jgi:predicted metalloprotease